MKNTPAETEGEINTIESFLKESEKKQPLSKDQGSQTRDGSVSFTASFLTEMVQFIKNTLLSINNVNLLSVEKANDVEFRKYCRKSIYQDIKKIDSLLNALLNYININTPIVKKNTIHIILEEILEANEKQIQTKSIKILEKFEENLPETFIHDEQVRFILNSILQYAILSTPYEGSIGFLTRSIEEKGTGSTEDKGKVVPLKERRSIEVLIVSTSHKDALEQLEKPSEGPAVENEKEIGLILQLIRELIQRSQGMIEFEVDEKKTRTICTLRLPCERRQVVYYEPIKL
jgi:nitrogen-specific signal transduction histidine kinase